MPANRNTAPPSKSFDPDLVTNPDGLGLGLVVALEEMGVVVLATGLVVTGGLVGTAVLVGTVGLALVVGRGGVVGEGVVDEVVAVGREEVGTSRELVAGIR